MFYQLSCRLSEEEQRVVRAQYLHDVELFPQASGEVRACAVCRFQASKDHWGIKSVPRFQGRVGVCNTCATLSKPGYEDVLAVRVKNPLWFPGCNDPK